jgi:hypothetical protein
MRVMGVREGLSKRSRAAGALAARLAGRVSLLLSYGAAVILLAPAGAASLLAPAQALAGPLELVPAYFGPEGAPDPWNTMCELAPPGSTVILNPNNGPVKREATTYAQPIRSCEERGARVIGYVFTKYGKRHLSAVEKAIAHYYSWYPGVEGIFLDEMAETPTANVEAYYSALTSYVHEKGGFVVGNPGDTATTPWQLATVDEVVTFEGSAASYAAYTPAPWVLAAQPRQIANIIYAASEGQMQADCVKAQERNTGSVYLTDLPERPNPYATLPSYWAAETALC